jgi:hypothetical protein
MARPPKQTGQAKDKDLRIPVTVGDRDTVNQGAVAAGMDMATWARPILLAAAKRELAKARKTKSGL